MCGTSLSDGIDAVDPRFKNELTKDAAPDDTRASPPLLPPPLPGASCAPGHIDTSTPALFAGAFLAVLGVSFPRRSPSTLATCSPMRAAGTTETAAAAAAAAAIATATDTGCADDNGAVPLLGGLTTADGATAAAAAGAAVSKVSNAVVAAGRAASVAGAAAAEGLPLFRSPSA